MQHTLYGDGIHDDTAALQEMIDESSNELLLKSPKNFYLISKALEIPSNFRLVLPRFAEIRLADNSNCLMLRNKAYNKSGKLIETCFPDHTGGMHVHNNDDFDINENIEVTGGIWNYNNMGQRKNPIHYDHDDLPYYTGTAFFFFGVRNLRISNLTIKDPVTYAATFDTISYFTFENITFDFNYGNPRPANMDGIHLNGNCHYGVFRNLKGTCYDDLIALNADEGSDGPITNIEIDGLFAEDCHSAVRMLTVKHPFENVHISNVYGTYYQYCIALSKCYAGDALGYYDGISIDHIYASKAERRTIYGKDGCYVFALIWVEPNINVKSLSISELYRKEKNIPIETLFIGDNTKVDLLTVDRVSFENNTGTPTPFIVNNGDVKKLVLGTTDIRGDEIIKNNGVIENQTKMS